MPTSTIYCTQTRSGYVGVAEPTYSECRNAEESALDFISDDPSDHVGPYTHDFGSSWRIYESAWEFDLTGLPSNISIESVALEAELQYKENDVADPEVRVIPGTGQLSPFSNAWIKPTTLGNHDYFASASNPPTGILSFTIQSAASAAIKDAVDGNGYLRLNVSSDLHRIGNSSDHRLDWDPTTVNLTITYNNLPSAPGSFTSPTSTSEWTGTQTVDWGAASDPDGDALTYQLQYSGDNGSSWTTLASGISGTTYDWNTLNHATTDAAKLRVRAHDGKAYGPWTESDTFSIGHPPTAPTVTAPNGGETYDAVESITWTAGSDPEGESLVYDVDLSIDNGGSWSRIVTGATGTSTTYDFSGEPSTTSALVRIRARDPGNLTSAWDESDNNFTIQHNVAPNAPTLDNPVGGATIDRTTTERFQWTFSDPDTGDSQSKYDIQIRQQGTTTNIVDATETTTNTFRDVSGGTIGADGNYEWRVRTYDSQGVVGPWSAWESFATAVPPDPPSITDPVSGQTVGTEEYVVKWSAPDQVSYQLRRVADNAGSPDTSTVYSDTGEVVTATARDQVVSFPTNNRWEHVQIRVKYDGLWSDWASNRVEISYTAPAVPTTVITEEDENGRILVDVTNPAPTGDQPTVTSNDIFRREQGDEDWTRIATGIVPSGSYDDYTPRSGQSYEYRVRAFGDNGVSSYSTATETPGVILRGSWLHNPEDPADTIHQFVYNAEGGTETWEPEVELKRYAGRTMPVAEFGEHEGLEIDLELALDEAKDEPTILRSLAGLKSPLCYRDAAGRKAFVVIPSLPRTHRFYGADSSVSLLAIDYDEEV